MAQSNSRLQLENWLKQIDIKGSVLDIGGSVQTLEGRVKSFHPSKYLIMDNGSEKWSHEKWIEPDIKADICNIVKPDYGDFDQIFMIEVSEYLINPNTALANIYALLKRGGEFYSSWHFICPQHPPKGKDILRYTPTGVERLLTEAGFEIVENIPRVMKDDFSKSAFMGMVANEGMRGWKDFDNTIIGSIVKARKL